MKWFYDKEINDMVDKYKIVLVVGSVEFIFELNIIVYNGLINDMVMDNKIVLVFKYLCCIISKEIKEVLDEILKVLGVVL